MCDHVSFGTKLASRHELADWDLGPGKRSVTEGVQITFDLCTELTCRNLKEQRPSIQQTWWKWFPWPRSRKTAV